MKGVGLNERGWKNGHEPCLALRDGDPKNMLAFSQVTGNLVLLKLFILSILERVPSWVGDPDGRMLSCQETSPCRTR